MWYVHDVLYAGLYVRVSCFVVRGCGVSRRYIDIFYCDMFIVNVYIDQLCVVNKQFELLEFVSESVYVDLQYDEIYLTFTAGSMCLCGVSSHVVVLGLFVRLS